MKNLAFIFSILLMGFSATATSPESENNLRRGYDGNAYIFVEGDVEFSVFPDGQFDFIYVGPQKGSQITISSPNVNVSFNSGYNYDAYVQYDDYGAVIQVENVTVYYDEYGRIIQAGNVDIRYNDRRVVRVGGLHVIYNSYGYFSHCTGAINLYNPYYIYRPWHAYYRMPIYSHVIVYDYPYRRYYQPVRYSYHNHIRYYRNRDRVAYHNTRREFYRPGSRVHQQDGRVVRNNNFDPNRRNTMIANSGRNNQTVGNSRTNDATTTRNNANTNRNTVDRNSGTSRTNASTINKTNRVNTSTTRDNASTTRSSVTNSNVRATNNTNVSNTRTVRNTPTTTSSNNRSASVTQNKTQAPPVRTTTHTSTVRKTNTPSRSSSNVNTSRGNSSAQSNSARTRG